MAPLQFEIYPFTDNIRQDARASVFESSSMRDRVSIIIAGLPHGYTACKSWHFRPQRLLILPMCLPVIFIVSVKFRRRFFYQN